MRLGALASHNQEIDYIPNRFPFPDFLVAQGLEDGVDIRLPEGFSVTKDIKFGNHHVKIFSNGLEGYDRTGKVFFSGFCLTGSPKQHFRGAADIDEHKAHAREIRNSIGTFTLIEVLDDSIEISADYFGAAKLFVYSLDNVVLVSNRYHLLISALGSVPGRLILDKSKVKALLATAYHEAFAHNFSSNCIASGVFQLYPGEGVSLDGRAVSKFRDPSYFVCEGRGGDSGELDKFSYIDLLHKAASEIKENTKAIVSSKHYDHIVMDLSGGMDSRVVYCAASNSPETFKRMRIRTIRSKDELDHVVATQINSLYGIQYNTDEDISSWERLPYEVVYSFIMEGKYFLPALQYPVAHRTIQLNGFYGEVCMRPRGTVSFLDGLYYDFDGLTIEEFVEGFVSFRGSPVMICGYEEAGCELEAVIKDEYDRIPGESLHHKIENHYLTYSHSYHSTETTRAGFGRDSFSVMKSKELFSLWRRLLGHVKNRKLGFDLIYLLNPLVSVIPYENEKYNDDYKSSKSDLVVGRDPVFSEAQLVPTDSLRAWEEAGRNTKSGMPTTFPFGGDDNEPLSDKEACLRLIKGCLELDPVLFQDIKYSLVHYVGRVDHTPIGINTLRHKLAIIYYHLNLAGDST